MLYWPEFTFDFRLDFPRLLPHIVAIESYQEAASNRILPPQWREQPLPEDAEGTPQRPGQNPIDARKQQLLLRNASAPQAWVRNRFVPGSDPISLDDIVAMHRMVAAESGVYTNSGGALRTLPVQVGGAVVGGIHLGAPVEKLPRLMRQYVSFINGDCLWNLPAMIHALAAHFFFTTIHPFDDGNGRMSRLVSAAILFQRGYNGHGFYALSSHFYYNDIKYHSLLHQCWQRPLPFDLTEFVAFGLEGLAMELQGIRHFVKIKLNRAAERQILTPALRKRLQARSQR